MDTLAAVLLLALGLAAAGAAQARGRGLCIGARREARFERRH